MCSWNVDISIFLLSKKSTHYLQKYRNFKVWEMFFFLSPFIDVTFLNSTGPLQRIYVSFYL